LCGEDCSHNTEATNIQKGGDLSTKGGSQFTGRRFLEIPNNGGVVGSCGERWANKKKR